MPVIKDKSTGKWKIGSGKPIYDTKEKAERAYRGYLGSKYSKLNKGGSMQETKLNFFVPISKLDEEQRMVYGVATCSKLDNQNEIVDYDATKKALEEYSQWRNIREMHKPSAVGIAPILELRDANQELFIGAKIVDDQAWQKCKEGVYKGFSIGGETLDRKMELDKASGKTINRVTKYLLNEISIVDRPANPACKFQTVKRDSSMHVITTSVDPLKDESARVMEKSILLAKRILSKDELEKLPDSAFGLIKITMDGDTIVKQRDYPMPDKVHAINMIRKMSGAIELTDIDKENIHQVALSVLGKKHNQMECPYCISKNLKGGVQVSKEIKKDVRITHEPDKKTVEILDGPAADKTNVKPAADAIAEEKATDKAPAKQDVTPAEEQKPHIATEDAAAEASALPVGEAPANDIGSKLDRILSLLEGALGSEGETETESMEEPVDDYNEEPETVDAKEPVVEEELVGEKEKKPIVIDEEPATAVMKPCGKAEDECVKTVKTETVKKSIKPVVKSNLLSKIRSVIEPLAKENKELKARLEKLEKAPLPRKDAVEGQKPQKVEKYQDVKLEKKETKYDEQLQKDIEKAQDIRKINKGTLSKDEQTFVDGVLKRMEEARLSK